MNDLNQFQIENDGNFSQKFVDNSMSSDVGISVYFRNLQHELILKINSADAVFGAVAWLTNYEILDALADVGNVSIIVQKEDFLRPDINARNDFKTQLRRKYNALSCSLTRYSFENILNSVSIASDPSVEPVRCVGNHNSNQKPAFPRMHNKFLVFCKVHQPDNYSECELIQPYAIWTGSFNLTKNASLSLENALYITNIDIVKAYFREYGQIAAMSEPLDWTSEWAAPEWRIGT